MSKHLKKTEKTKRNKALTKYIVSYILKVVIARLIPVAFIIYEYGIFEEQNEQALTGMFLVTIIFLTFVFYKDVKQKIVVFADEKLKHSLPETKYAIFFFLLWLVIVAIQQGIGNIETVIFVVFLAVTASIPTAIWHKSIEYELIYYNDEDEEEV